MFRKSSREQPPSTPQPTYMSRDQMGNFLNDLRSNRPQRPMGTRPLPWLRAAASKSDLNVQKSATSEEPPKLEAHGLPHRSASALALRQDSSEPPNQQRESHIARPLVRQPSSNSTKRQPADASNEKNQNRVAIPYVENGLRWMDRQESRSISMALRDMDLKEQQQLHAAAQDEASELVWKHQNPSAPYRNPDAAKYKAHLRKGSHARAHSVEKPNPMERSGPQPERSSASDSSGFRNSEQPCRQNSRIPSDPSLKIPPTSDECQDNELPSQQEAAVRSRTLSKKSYGGLAETVAKDISTHRRTSSGTKRKASRGTIKSTFQNPDDQIYEESDEVQNAKIADPRPPPIPLSMRRNPFARVKFAQQEKHERSNSEPILHTKKFNKYEIHKNPPSQSRNPEYTLNPSTPPRPTTPNDCALAGSDDSLRMKDGKEIRGDDIRAATSMRMKDRSPKLPTPIVVSDKPGRPIVSFDPDWKPKEVELKEGTLKSTPSPSSGSEVVKEPERPSPMPIKAATTTGVPTLNVLDIASRERAHSPPPAIHNDTMATSIVVPVINVDTPQVPKINEPEPPANPSFSHPQAPLTRSNTTPVPIINVPDESGPAYQQPFPSISIGSEEIPRPSQASIPSINLPDQTQPSSRQRPLPAIHAPNDTRGSSSQRPLPAITTPDISQPSRSCRPLPTINMPSSNEAHPKQNPRPLPQPSSSGPRPNPLRHAFTTPTIQTTTHSPNRHWTPSVRRTQAQCAQCALPIAGRIVSAANQRFHPECFTCHHCGEGLECVAFYPEPDVQRSARLDRIRRRQAGEHTSVADDDQPSDFDDGDEGPRFYCHLDFHEFFSPRCKSCRTPIEGEVVVACGAEWHVGHFFCAQCGDPFDAQMPFVEKDGYAWCVGCHTNRYSAKCRKCRRPVTEVVVKALGAEWHQECFVCMECGGDFGDGRYFLRGESQDPVCVKCEARRLKA